MRKLIALLLAVILFVSLVACGDNNRATSWNDLPNASTFGDSFNTMLQEITNNPGVQIVNNYKEESLNNEIYDQSIQFECVGTAVFVLADVIDGKVVKCSARVSKDLMESVSDQEKASLLVIISSVAKMFTDEYKTAEDLSELLGTVFEQEAVQRDEQTTVKTYEKDGLVYKYKVIDYNDGSIFDIALSGYSFEVEYPFNENEISKNDMTIIEPTVEPTPEATSVPENSDIQVAAPAEWDEMPIHKCVQCGGVARNHSGAWNCDECYYCFGEEEFGDEAVFEDFTTGKWEDSWSQRAVMNVTQNSDGTATMNIKWVSGADSTTQWVMTGTFLDYENIIMYFDANQTISTSEGVTEVYNDGSGFFYLRNGCIYWVDYKEHAGYDCAFEYMAADENITTDIKTEEITETYTYYHYKWTGKTTIGTPYRVYSKDKNHHAESALAAGFTLDSTEPVYEEYVFDTYNGDSFYTALTADSSGLEEQWFIKK